MEGAFAWVVSHGAALIQIGGVVLLLAAMIAALTPTHADDDVIGRIKNLYDKFTGKGTPPAA